MRKLFFGTQRDERTRGFAEHETVLRLLRAAASVRALIQ